MHLFYMLASAVLVFTAFAHSVIGEMMIFRKVSGGKIIPVKSAPPLQGRNIRILWATWHIVSVFGLVFALVLFRIGRGEPIHASWLAGTIAIACLAAGFLVLVATRGRHPGWISLSLAAALTLTALSAS
ncbi:MAG: hypothetical protein ACK4LQ_11640 [Pararhodobacter sp.]